MIRPLGAALLVLGLVMGTGSAGPARAVAAHHEPVLHRIVWDESLRGRPGVHLWAADRDGSHARKIFTSHRGFITELTMDRDGRRVAFAPCCRRSLPRLEVVNVRTGRIQRPLSRRSRFYSVGGIGWSPDGGRIVFEGYVEKHGRPTSALWTVRPDGRGLHELLPLDDPVTDLSADNETLAWTRRGVLYCDRTGLRIARDGHSRPLIRNVYSVRISGDGRQIVTERANRAAVRATIWVGDPDGTHQRLLWRSAVGLQGTNYGYPVPDFHGRRLLVERSSDPTGDADGIVSWKSGNDPAQSPPLPFLVNAFPFTWN